MRHQQPFGAKSREARGRCWMVERCCGKRWTLEWEGRWTQASTAVCDVCEMCEMCVSCTATSDAVALVCYTTNTEQYVQQRWKESF